MKSNVVLIGMPAVGKSTIGVLLAKTLLKSFVDTDLIIQSKCGCGLCDIIEKEGTDTFLKIENDIICSQEYSSSVVATGGSAVYGKEAMSHLQKDGVIIYLDISLGEIEKRIGNITTRGVAMKNGDTLADLYKERAPLYNKYADIIVDCNGKTAEQTVSEITEKLNIIFR
ncbi:MAG: shikimate kinase [Clostridia bacterium]|nr:shikimate kinase [Clostridia bacterium]MBO7319694.1 shikimate kinase [Clostridia bacterium]